MRAVVTTSLRAASRVDAREALWTSTEEACYEIYSASVDPKQSFTDMFECNDLLVICIAGILEKVNPIDKICTSNLFFHSNMSSFPCCGSVVLKIVSTCDTILKLKLRETTRHIGKVGLPIGRNNRHNKHFAIVPPSNQSCFWRSCNELLVSNERFAA